MRKILLITLFPIVGVISYFSLLSYKRDQAIKTSSAESAAIQSLCFSMEASKKISCLSEQLRSISKIKNNNFFLVKDSKKEKIEAEILDTHVKIKRTSDMTFGGKCVSTFFLFEVDNQNLYLSKDNETGLIYCLGSGNEFLITSGDLSESKVKNDLQLLLGSRFKISDKLLKNL